MNGDDGNGVHYGGVDGDDNGTGDKGGDDVGDDVDDEEDEDNDDDDGDLIMMMVIHTMLYMFITVFSLGLTTESLSLKADAKVNDAFLR
jgi:hypothetical protein